MKTSRLICSAIFVSTILLGCHRSMAAHGVLGTAKVWGWLGSMEMHKGNEPTTDAPQDGYHETSVENLSRLYWALGMLNEKDDLAIEQFLFINDCDLFNQFSQNTEQWPQIKATVRDMICKKKDEFATRFEVLIPVKIGNLDASGKEYALNPPLTDVRQLEVSDNANAEVCGSRDDMKSYPRSLLLNLAAPVTITSVPATQELNEHIQKNPKNTAAVVRLKVRIGKYVDTKQINGSWHAVVTASVAGYEFYSDMKETKLLFAKDLPLASLGERAERAKKAKAEEEEKDKTLKNTNLNDLYTADQAPEENDYSAAEATNPDDPCARGALPF